MISSNQTEIDLGDVKLGESRHFSVQVTNTYNKTLAVGVAFGCSACTTGGFYPDNNIAPEGARTLNLKFTPTATGLQAKTVRLTYLPPSTNKAVKLVIRFKANVIE